MLGVSSGSADGAAAAEQPHDAAGIDETSDRTGTSGGGNRWPRQETLALLKIRSDMDVIFRDSTLKGPLWEQVSRKMAELGFQRNAKKCKEKFENVYKYHKRTKDGRTSKPEGKSYRFFDQLEALENTSPISFIPPPLPRIQAAPLLPLPPPPPPPQPAHDITVSSTSPNPISVMVPPSNQLNSSSFQLQSQSQPTLQLPPPPINNATSNPPPQTHAYSNLWDSTSSSSTSSDEDIQMRRGKKRKMKDFFEKLMRDVVQKQEEMQIKFLETLQKRDHDRMAREEAWRNQEMLRLNKEHELLVKERSIAAAKDEAVIAYLQKVTDQHNNLQPPMQVLPVETPQPPPRKQPPIPKPMPMPMPIINPTSTPTPVPTPTPPPPPTTTTTPQPQVQQISFPPASTPTPTPAPAPTPAQQGILAIMPTKTLDNAKLDITTTTTTPAGSSRWPKAEIEALIKLRTDLELKYQDNGPKGPLWEEISSAMGKIGYNRNPKRCKEKWENINKYFKKVKESNKKRSEDSKTCPYFSQLDALYKEKAKNEVVSMFSLGYSNPVQPIMAQPEQQWPITQKQQNNIESDNNYDNEDEGDDDEDDEDGGGYEIVANKQASTTVSNAAE